METNEKARFFAMYLDSPLAVVVDPIEHWYPFDKNEGGLVLTGVFGERIIVKRIAEEVEDRFNQCALNLKPLSLISDEDAEAIAKYRYNDSKALTYLQIGKCIIKEYLTGQLKLEQYEVDYLRSKSYALPYLNFSVEKLIEMNWIKLK